MITQVYANLGVKVDGVLLQQQAGILIEDHVSRRCRVTIESALPSSGAELDARTRLGERVKVSVHIVGPGRGEQAVGPSLVEIEEPIIASRLEQPTSDKRATMLVFTVEDQPAKETT